MLSKVKAEKIRGLMDEVGDKRRGGSGGQGLGDVGWEKWVKGMEGWRVGEDEGVLGVCAFFLKFFNYLFKFFFLMTRNVQSLFTWMYVII